MYLVNEKHIVRIKRRKNAGKVAGLVENRTGGNFYAYSELIGNNAGKSCLAKSGRAEKQYMVKSLGAHFGRGGKNPQVLYNLLLAAESLETPRSERFLKFGLCTGRLLTYIEFFFFHLYK